MDDSDTTAKVADSGYSNSCSNSQSRTSRSSKSTHSGCHSSGSSGYGGKLKNKKEVTKNSASNFIANTVELPDQRNKVIEIPKKTQVQTEVTVPHAEQPELPPTENVLTTKPTKEEVKAFATPMSEDVKSKNGAENLEVATCGNHGEDGFLFVISMHDGVVMYTTASLTTTLGFPKEMWIGRSFIDFVHTRDRKTFASQITIGLTVPETKIDNIAQENEASPLVNTVSTMVCRIRRYRGLTTGFGVTDHKVVYMPFLLKLSFKNHNDEAGKVVYLIIQATPFLSAFKTRNEMVDHAVPFIIRHAAMGKLEYIDPESVPYLGYIPQDIVDKDALTFYHPEDLNYLQQVYETIVKEGGVLLSKGYRMLAQNGNYVKVETEFSSFINPWSRKLEFVTGKHHVIEGPDNPDVFQEPDTDNSPLVTDDERAKAMVLRDNIIMILNEVLTKPAEVAKQQMSRRCQDLAMFMETLIKNPVKHDDELRLEIQDAEHSYYERDSVLLGGISPHHEYSDSKLSTETPLSYNHLNYDALLRRYFESHEPYCLKDKAVTNEDNIFEINASIRNNTSDQKDSDPSMLRDDSLAASPGDYKQPRLTESLLIKHNEEMERDLAKNVRDHGVRKCMKVESRQKKREHLARCNAPYTCIPKKSKANSQPRGVKRSRKQTNSRAKKHCTQSRDKIRNRKRHAVTASATKPTGTVTNTTGVIPMYYLPVSNSDTTNYASTSNHSSSVQFVPPAVPCVMYGQPMFPSPIMYPALNPAVSHSQMMPPQNRSQNLPCSNAAQNSDTNNPLGLASSNYEEACKTSILPKTTAYFGAQWKERRRAAPSTSISTSLETDRYSTISALSNFALNRCTAAVSSTQHRNSALNQKSEEYVDKTDGESSYSSFYSTFFRTDSGSADDSGDVKRATNNQTCSTIASKRVAKRKLEPPWLDQVCVTSELVYKYQIATQNIEEVLTADKQKMQTLEQPAMVTEQLGQLYMDLQLEGVASRLTLEEGISSSSSSGEESSSTSVKCKKKRQYSRLMMIYEEDAPMPPPSTSELLIPDIS